MRLVWGTVTAVEQEATGFQLLVVALDVGEPGSAICYPALCGACVEGDRILLNTTAVGLGLGTGGRHFVLVRADGIEGVAFDEPSGGHIMKLRYTPMQRDVLSVESPESPHHSVMSQATGLDGLPVVCCGLHSQVPLAAAAIKTFDPSLRIAYCMTDSASLSLPLSDVVRACVSAGLLDSTISCGQAFGGEFESVNLHSGLLAAKYVASADVAIVAIGPGVVGTATPFGHGGVAQGEAINAVAALGGTPIAALRVSFADARQRHRVVSHHTLAALTGIALAPALVAVPALPAELAEQIAARLAGAGVWGLHRPAHAYTPYDEAPDLRGIAVTTMRRGPAEDPAFFAAAYAAGEIAARAACGESF
ncbi:MAG: DUF3866 family protein [Coriobacteriia bacterium]|nr:DUF3866 family protein [Coriobacteriia bacterium]